MDAKLFFLALLCCYVNAQWDCTTYLDSVGNCVALEDCGTLNAMLTGPRRDKNAYEILKKYNCGYIGDKPKVCCPAVFDMYKGNVNGKDCITPDGDEGTCKNLEDCGYLRDQFGNQGFVSEENMEFFKRSKCSPKGTSKSVSVCCKTDGSRGSSPPPPIPDNRIQEQCVLNAFPPDIDSKCCGIESSSDVRIIGGTVTAIDQFPWLVLIEYSREGYSCGGSLISGKYVLTAAHCLVGSKGKSRDAVRVRLGEYNTTNSGADCTDVAGGGEDCTEGTVTIPIESYVVYEDYDADQVYQYHDIGLIRLKELAPYTDFIRPICLPTSDFTVSPPDPLDLYISGWGVFDKSLMSSEVKLYAKVPYVGTEQCQARYQALGRKELTAAQICVGGEANKDSCKGDSGGPLMMLKHITHEAAGVISFGPQSCGLKNWPSIYTKVYDYLDWIKEKIKA